MGARDLLASLDRAGFTVVADGGRLIVGPSTGLTDELRAAIRSFKSDLLATLTETPCRGAYALSDDEAVACHATPWDEAAGGRFVARASQLMRLGLGASDADDLAERLHLRDVLHDDCRMCVECRHHRGGPNDDRCANSVKAGPRVRGPHAPTLLQRCPGFALASV